MKTINIPDDFPKIVCLCGSTRFGEEFAAANKDLTLAGVIVLSVGELTRHIKGRSPQEEFGDEAKVRLDGLHKRKIDLSDWIYVLNVDGYIGESTKSEIEYAFDKGKPVLFHEPLDYPSMVGEYVLQLWSDNGRGQSAEGKLDRIEDGVAILEWGYGVELDSPDFMMFKVQPRKLPDRYGGEVNR